MRKIIILMMCVIMLTGCGGKPSDVSDEMYENAVYTIKVCDLYLDGEATQEETIEKIDGIVTPEIDIVSASSNEVSIWSGIMGLKTDCIKMRLKEFELSSFNENRDKIADAINYKD